MNNQISITQGLAELKLLDKRLNKGLDGLVLMAVRTKTRDVDSEKLHANASRQVTSYNDLVKRRDTIKRAIVLSNSKTFVKVGDWAGTVAEAIEQKSSITYKQRLLEKMKEQYTLFTNECNEEKEKATSRLDRLLSSELGKDVKTNPETVVALTASFEIHNKVELLDPFDIKTAISQLSDSIDSFTTNVDWVLSESNGKTMITV